MRRARENQWIGSEHTVPRLKMCRPKGTPTNFEMADFVLVDAEKQGNDAGLTGNELVQAIAARYWPGLIGPQILPSIYQFAKIGRLKLSGGKFKRVHKKMTCEAI